MKLINQRTNTDCVIASTAMMLKISYEESVELHRKHIAHPPKVLKVGLGWHDTKLVLEAVDKIPIRLHQFYQYASGLVTVPSLNTSYSTHSIYWNGKEEKCYDPQEGREGKKFYTDEMVIKSFCKFITTIDEFNVDVIAQLELQELQQALNKYEAP